MSPQFIRANRLRLALIVGACALLAIVLAAPRARAATTFTVNTTADQVDGGGCVSTSVCSLRDAVIAADAAGSGTIVVPAGTYILTIPSAGENDPTTGDLDINNGASVSITGAGAGQTIIDANQIDRAFAVQAAATLDVDGVTIEKGAASDNSSDGGEGGAIYSDGTLSVSDSTITASSGERGGAIFTDGDAGSTTITDSTLSTDFSGDDEGKGGAIDLEGGTLAITGTTFATDSSYDYGGAIYADAGAVTISGSTFSGDSAGYGGAILVDASPVAIDTSTFSGDSASTSDEGAGGAIADAGEFEDGGGLSITSSVFSGDSAGEYGGAIAYGAGEEEGDDAAPAVKPAAMAEPGGLSISDTEITGSAASYGGGLYLDGGGIVEIDGSTIDHNSAAYEDGGGIYLNHVGSATITDTTISDNQSGNGAGVYFANEVPVQFTNDTIAGNTTGDDANNDDGTDGGGVYDPSEADDGDGGGFVNTIIADNTGGDCGDGTAGDADQGHNLDSDASCFPGGEGGAIRPNVTAAATGPVLGPLEDNGAAPIGAKPGDGAILTQLPTAGSGAIDTGSNPACTADDARGTPRPYNGTCDVGAVEVAPAVLSIGGLGAATGTVGVPFNDTFTVTNAGPAPSGLTVLTFTVPTGESFYGVSPANGTCTSSGSTVTCDLADILSGASTSVTLVVAGNSVGSFTNSVTATNVEGSSATGAVTTNVTAAAPGSTSTATASTVTVTTPSASLVKPTAVTGSASKLVNTGSTVSGEVTTGGASTTYFFQYGTTTKYGYATPVLATTQDKAVDEPLKGLKAGTVYHYRLLAINANGQATGRDRTFKTPGSSALGALLLDSHTLAVSHGAVKVTFTCDSAVTCSFKFALTTPAEIGGTGQIGPVLVTNEENTVKTIGAHQRLTVTETVTKTTLALLRKDGGQLTAKLTSRPRTGQKGLITAVRLTS